MGDEVGTRCPDLLTVLQLLVEEAPLESYEELLRRADREGSTAERLRLEQGSGWRTSSTRSRAGAGSARTRSPNWSTPPGR